jgi:hypothetical protein
MSSGTDRLRKATLAVTVMGLLGVTAACGKTGETPAGDAGPTAAAATSAKTTAAQKSDGKTVDAGMQAACDVVHQLFDALGSGDRAKAEGLRSTSHDMFQTIVDYTAGPDKQLAGDADAMATALDKLPAAPAGQSDLADKYASDCVRQYGAAPLKS